MPGEPEPTPDSNPSPESSGSAAVAEARPGPTAAGCREPATRAETERSDDTDARDDSRDDRVAPDFPTDWLPASAGDAVDSASSAESATATPQTCGPSNDNPATKAAAATRAPIIPATESHPLPQVVTIFTRYSSKEKLLRHPAAAAERRAALGWWSAAIGSGRVLAPKIDSAPIRSGGLLASTNLNRHLGGAVTERIEHIEAAI